MRDVLFGVSAQRNVGSEHRFFHLSSQWQFDIRWKLLSDLFDIMSIVFVCSVEKSKVLLVDIGFILPPPATLSYDDCEEFS